jgi:hypothetical protein
LRRTKKSPATAEGRDIELRIEPRDQDAGPWQHERLTINRNQMKQVIRVLVRSEDAEAEISK